jgi:hypothetical protein
MYIVCFSGFSQSEGKRMNQFNLDRKVAIQGYDQWLILNKVNFKKKGFDFLI